MTRSYATSGATLDQLNKQSECLGDFSCDLEVKEKKSSGIFDSVADFFKNLIGNKPEPEI